MIGGPALVILSPLASTSDDCLAPGTTPAWQRRPGCRSAPGLPDGQEYRGSVLPHAGYGAQVVLRMELLVELLNAQGQGLGFSFLGLHQPQLPGDLLLEVGKEALVHAGRPGQLIIELPHSDTPGRPAGSPLCLSCSETWPWPGECGGLPLRHGLRRRDQAESE